MTEREVQDRLAITDSIYRYCRSVDRLDVALGHSVFHPDSYADFDIYKKMPALESGTVFAGYVPEAA